jgi:hypothetical protein
MAVTNDSNDGISTASGTNGDGSWLLVKMPYGPKNDATSYLRLGSVAEPSLAGSPTAPPSTGEDLASQVTSFLDDRRSRDGSPSSIDEATRVAESAVLHTKGGWRDHTDGNRVTTTRGDKVEVIGGNYKMVVLGRGEGDAGWDVSGGNIEGLGTASCIKWVQTFGGTWRTHEWSEKGDSEVIQHGNRVDSFYGESMKTTTGSEDETRPIEDDDHVVTGYVPAPNPVIIDRTWARRMASYTGSAARRVPSLTSETWADRIESKTVAGSMSDSTTVDGDMSTSTTVRGNMSNSTTVDGAMTDTTTAAMMTSVNLVPLMNNITVGNNLMVNIGAIENINLGVMLDITLAGILQLSVSGTLAVSLGTHAQMNLADEINLAGDRQHISGATTHVAGVMTQVADMVSTMAGLISLG